mgnify:CR=1 FL=1
MVEIQFTKIILADEPTGSLDSKSARQLLEMMEEMNQNMKATILMVTFLNSQNLIGSKFFTSFFEHKFHRIINQPNHDKHNNKINTNNRF